MARATWDIFCRVVDNYGDVGIAWRLARQLAADECREVRLIVDGIESLTRIAPSVEAGSDRQAIDGIEIVRASDFATGNAADVVVELLGCGLPDAYLDAMEARRGASVWIDFEHLSAEPWVAGFHGMPSPHPTRGLVKHFFYPGFDERTGGLLIEPGFGRHDAAFHGPMADAFAARIGVPSIDGAKCISLFAYREAPIAALLDALASDRAQRWSLIVPGGVLAEAIDRWFGSAGRSRVRGALTVTTIPFLEQDDYDRLLAFSDVNFVRGEDSFVRAQAAGRPFVWHIYPQACATHLAKLAAFEDLYEKDLPVDAACAQRAFWRAWNDPRGDVGGTVGDWLRALPQLRVAAQAWRARTLAQPPLIERLGRFVVARRSSP